LLSRFEQFDSTFCSLCTFQPPSFIYLSPAIERLLGHPMKNFAEGGFQFYMSITERSCYPYIMAKQAQYIKQINSTGFNYLKPMPMEYDASFVHADGRTVKVNQVSVMLDFEPGADIRTFFAVWILVDNHTNSERNLLKNTIRGMLKELHRLLFGPLMVQPEELNGNKFLVKLKTPEVEVPELSSRERELLILLSKGRSLKEVATAMKVSYFTAETHRKNVFRKFQTKSVAELIKKASKVFWLE